MNPIEKYVHDRDEQVRQNMKNGGLSVAAEKFTEQLVKTNYVKSFTWMGVPILQYPADLVVIQEIIYKTNPTLIIECGIAFGGLTIFLADMLANTTGIVYGVDIDIREHTRQSIIDANREGIYLKQSSSVEPAVVEEIKAKLEYSRDGDWGPRKIMVILDSNHTHTHVLRELELYAPLVSVGSYIIAMDTAIEFWGHLDRNQERPWGKGNSPWTAAQEFLETGMGQNFVIDKEVETRALVTSAPDGWLRRIK